MDVNNSESGPRLSSNTDISQVRQLVEKWRQAHSQLRFECQRQRDELVHMGMHERLCEDSEKLLRRENAALKEALAQHADTAARLLKLRVESDALKEDLDDARASLCAATLEHEARQTELRRQLDSESRAHKEAELKLASEITTAATLREELEARRDENRVLAAELEECRKELKAKDQELRCQVIAVRLERDEEVARIRGRLEWLQTSGHDACREQCAALQHELARARDEIARLKSKSPLRSQAPVRSSALSLSQRIQKTPGKDPARSSESPGQGHNASSSQWKMWPGALAGASLKDPDGANQGSARGLGGKTSEGGIQGAHASPAQGRPPPLGNAKATTSVPACRSSSVNYKPVSDGTVDSTRGATDSGDGVIDDQELPFAAEDVAGSPKPCAARGSFRVSDLLAKSAQRRGTPRLFGGGRGREDALEWPGDLGSPTVREDSDGASGAVVPETPPRAEAKMKKRKLCLEVDDMLFVDA